MSTILLPPPHGVCPVCAVAHRDEDPHNLQSPYYQMRFHALRGRFPTWADAIAHCNPKMKAFWMDGLEKYGAWSEPPAGIDVVADPPAESVRQVIEGRGSSRLVSIDEGAGR